MNGKGNSPSLVKYILLSLLVFILALLISILSRMLLVFDGTFLGFSEEQAGLVTSMIEGVVGAAAAGLVLYQLKVSSNVEERQNSIQEAQFILQYNQAFIQDKDMCRIEQVMERFMLGQTDGPIINDENRQMFINYLVYLEGLAPLILRDVLHLSHVDDLFAYRFFLAVNNREIQEDQLFAFPDYYRGCFKLYEKWKQYRREQNREILMEEHSLDRWQDYEKYIDSPVMVRAMEEGDDRQAVAELIYGTDPYIYPAAFGTSRAAQKALPRLMDRETCAFGRGNIRVAVERDGIVGIAVVLTDPPADIDCDEFYAAHSRLPESFRHTCRNYFNQLGPYLEGDAVYIACVSVDPRRRGRRVGEMLIKGLIREFPGRRLKLHVLCDNGPAISLYRKYGFEIVGGQSPGYAYGGPAPLCYEMVRLPEKHQTPAS